MGIETFVPLRPLVVASRLRTRPQFLVLLSRANRTVRSYAAFNEEVVKRYEEWLLVQHYTPRTKQCYRRMVRTFIDLLTKSGVNIKTVLAKSSETATQNANGSLPTNSNLCRPPSMAPHGIDCQIYGLSCRGRLLTCFLPVNS